MLLFLLVVFQIFITLLLLIVIHLFTSQRPSPYLVKLLSQYTSVTLPLDNEECRVFTDEEDRRLAQMYAERLETARASNKGSPFKDGPSASDERFEWVSGELKLVK